MKKSLFCILYALLAASIFALAGCTPDDTSYSSDSGSKSSYTSTSSYGSSSSSKSSYSSSGSSSSSSHECYVCGKPASTKYGSYYYCSSCYAMVKAVSDSYGYWGNAMNQNKKSIVSSLAPSLIAVFLCLLLTQCGRGCSSSSSYSHECYICGKPASTKYGSYYYCPSCYSTMKSIADSYGY